jgi:hypothetical protein
MDSGASDQTYNTPAPEEKNGVARVSLIHGDVSTQRGDNGNWSAAVLNAPVLAGDRVSTGDKARTELQLDYANMLRLSADSQANINTLTHSQIQVQFDTVRPTTPSQSSATLMPKSIRPTCHPHRPA